MVSLLKRILQYGQNLGSKICIVDRNGSYTYKNLCEDIIEFRQLLDLNEGSFTKIGVLAKNDYSYVVCQFGVWLNRCIFVPLNSSHPIAENKYKLFDSQCTSLVGSEESLKGYTDTKLKLVPFPDFSGGSSQASLGSMGDLVATDPAMIIYTSGTTGNPKGALISHKALNCQINSLVDAWNWSSKDKILHVLPLHHVHGIVNALLCGIWSGATIEMMSRFEVNQVWKRIMQESQDLTLFMGVPTIYYKLLQAFEAMEEREKGKALKSLKQFRLMISGSSGLPVELFEKWHQLWGQPLLERYGMTEIGMALSNSANNASERKKGCVGKPLPGIEIRLAEGKRTGEIQVKGSTLFSGYWNGSKETEEAFTEDGWFQTGDIGQITVDGDYKILDWRL